MALNAFSKRARPQLGVATFRLVFRRRADLRTERVDEVDIRPSATVYTLATQCRHAEGHAPIATH